MEKYRFENLVLPNTATSKKQDFEAFIDFLEKPDIFAYILSSITKT